ncbi:hypothetical protein [Nonlabens agnitus]|uniref:Uncharacterized protein n=1 Tax=Nonlabens agnitus TaxID=870484 RepID=A0A2S9WRF6_9FLAO|nr:hypothetical protein [Nonlabens agnitus]PRP65866.1 hypothetical protein BST86_01565 [Nonlabens agnitus]
MDMALESKWCIDLWERAKVAFGYDDIQLFRLAEKVTMCCLPQYDIKQLVEHRFMGTGQQKAIAKLFYEKST